MKIGYDPLMHPSDKSYAMRPAGLMAHFAPEHEYMCDARRLADCDLFHGFRLPGRRRRDTRRQVVALFDLNFLHYPAMWPPPLRRRVVGTIRSGCLQADCVLTVRARYKRELTERLGLDERKIRVLPALQLLSASGSEPTLTEDRVRRKYMLPQRYLLMIGTNEPGHHQKTVVDAMIGSGAAFCLVVCGRRTAYGDRLLAYVREHHLATRISFIYEPDEGDLAAIYHMAFGLLYLPDYDASPLPVIGGLRCGLPMLLSRVPLNCETAGDAALYVDPASTEQVAEGLRRLTLDQALRGELARSACRRAELFATRTLARELQELYATL